MSGNESKKYQSMLESKRRDLLVAGLQNRENIVIEQAADTIDQVQFAAERELAIRSLDQEASLLRSVLGALQRIADGSYGTCLNCEEEIRLKRLDAVPWTKYCLRCQEAADRRSWETKTGDSLDETQAA